MITVSSNLATNLLMQRLGIENVRSTVHSLGTDGLQVLRGVEDSKAFEKGLSNTTSARGLQVFLTAIADGKAVGADSSRQMIEILGARNSTEASRQGCRPACEWLIKRVKS